MAAHDFDAFHSEGEIFFLLDLGVGQFAEKAWPAASTLKFHRGFEERGITANAVVDARICFVPVDPGEGAFGGRFTRDFELHRIQVFAPFVFGDVLPVFHVLPWVGLLRSI